MGFEARFLRGLQHVATLDLVEVSTAPTQILTKGVLGPNVVQEPALEACSAGGPGGRRKALLPARLVSGPVPYGLCLM